MKKKTLKCISICFLAMILFGTTVHAKAPTTTYVEVITGDMNGVATEIEATIYEYIGELTVEFPILTVNQDYTEAMLSVEKKTIHVARYREDGPQVEFRMTKGSDKIQSAFSVPTLKSYGYGDIYIEEGTDLTSLPQGFYEQSQSGEGFGTKELSSISYFTTGVVSVTLDYYIEPSKGAFGYVYMNDLLLITEEEEENFLKTGVLNERNTFLWPGLKELLTGGTSTGITQPEEKLEVKAVTVDATKIYTEVQVDAETVAFDAYMINNSNYFKLRDFAYAVNQSDKQFAVDWDEVNKAITLTSNTDYEPIGRELAITEGNGTIKVDQNTSTLYVDGQKVTLESYVIEGNTYFKLRDMAELFDIRIGYEPTTQQVSIHTF